MRGNQDKAHERWLLFVYRVPQDPPGRRTYVWRFLRQLGAIYLQQAAAILPDRPELRTALEKVAARVREFPGEVSVLETTSPSPEWERELVERFNVARSAEYAEVVENIEGLEDEVRRETSRGKFTFAELEDIEADWEKLQRWYERIRARDFFDSPDRLSVDEALERGHSAFETFAGEVYAHEGVTQADAREALDSKA